MKTLLKITICFLLIMNVNAQSSERSFYKIKTNSKTKNALKLNQKLLIDKGLYIDLTPQFGNQFISRSEAKNSKLYLKEFYEDFDFGINMGFNFKLKEQFQLKAIYNLGMLKFDESVNEKVNSCIVKLSIDYVF